MNKTIVVTGGTKGIGRAIVERFIKEGFDVLTCARNAEDLEELRMLSSDNARIHTFQADLSKKDQVSAFAAFVKEQSSDVDILVNNTGFFSPGQIHNEPEGTLEATIETNVYSAYNLTRALVSDMISKRSGHIFNICSVASITAYTNGGSYCISKFALLGMSKVLREELKPFEIRVTSVLPGATLTNSWAGVDIPAERFIKPEDVAEMIWATYVLSKGSVVEEILIRPQLGDL